MLKIIKRKFPLSAEGQINRLKSENEELRQKNADAESALVELAELYAEQDDALVELAELIAEG